MVPEAYGKKITIDGSYYLLTAKEPENVPFNKFIPVPSF